MRFGCGWGIGAKKLTYCIYLHDIAIVIYWHSYWHSYLATAGSCCLGKVVKARWASQRGTTRLQVLDVPLIKPPILLLLLLPQEQVVELQKQLDTANKQLSEISTDRDLFLRRLQQLELEGREGSEGGNSSGGGSSLDMQRQKAHAAQVRVWASCSGPCSCAAAGCGAELWCVFLHQQGVQKLNAASPPYALLSCMLLSCWHWCLCTV